LSWKPQQQLSLPWPPQQQRSMPWPDLKLVDLQVLLNFWHKHRLGMLTMNMSNAVIHDRTFLAERSILF
jgi:hypothetical protein